MRLACLCGGVEVTTARRPDHINACNCDLCRKAGARWGYFAPSEVTVTGETARYTRRDRQEPAVAVHFCPQCGATTHFRLTEHGVRTAGDTTTGVNMALADPAQLAGIELRYPDGKSWSGEGPFGHTRESRVLGPEG